MQGVDLWKCLLLDAEQGASHRAVTQAYARFARFVFDDEFEIRILAGKLSEAIQRMFPQGAVVNLEGIGPAVLSGPELDIVGAEIAHLLAGLGHQFMGAAAEDRKSTRLNPSH